MSGETMLYLQENWQNGIIVCTVVAVLIYVLVSTLIVIHARKNTVDICASGYIPVYNLVIPFRVLAKRHKDKKAAERQRRESEILNEDEEIIF